MPDTPTEEDPPKSEVVDIPIGQQPARVRMLRDLLKAVGVTRFVLVIGDHPCDHGCPHAELVSSGLTPEEIVEYFTLFADAGDKIGENSAPQATS